jgi:opacity protein-like surface antigen
MPAVVSAADMPVKAARVVVPPPPTWTGWYGGVSIGYASGQVTRGTPSAPETDNLTPNSVVATLLGGFDYQTTSNFVLGARVAVPLFSLKQTTPSTTVPLGVDVRRAVIFAGRVGYAMGPWLPYVIGGGVWGRGRAVVIGIATVDADHWGGIIGGGVEYRVAPNWSVDANVTYISMSKETYNFVPFGGLPVVHGFESTNFTIGLNYRP